MAGVKCPDCDKVFKNEAGLSIHRGTIHSKKKKSQPAKDAGADIVDINHIVRILSETSDKQLDKFIEIARSLRSWRRG